MKGSWSPDCQRLSGHTRICFEDWRARRAFKRTSAQLRLFLGYDHKRLRSPLTSLVRHDSRPFCVVVDELVLVLGIWSWIIGQVDDNLVHEDAIYDENDDMEADASSKIFERPGKSFRKE